MNGTVYKGSRLPDKVGLQSGQFLRDSVLDETRIFSDVLAQDEQNEKLPHQCRYRRMDEDDSRRMSYRCDRFFFVEGTALIDEIRLAITSCG
ncbi:hypothetical protein WN48_02810 [Eufriesea mexicana]|uniref:Uncharacterized protein n=1 Tax=Eufriesea mexicana TaxID=516756 RepID=A0A310SFD6_9HYME|nr:hypothetical protein WN48_02810 [Eufriesea mexicana]